MKEGIHPANYNVITIKCTCGYSFMTRAAYHEDVMEVTICSKCHPFFTGKQETRNMKSSQIQKFIKKYEGYYQNEN